MSILPQKSQEDTLPYFRGDVSLSADSSLQAAAVPGLNRSDPHGPGITRERITGGFQYLDPFGAEVTSPETLHRIGALGIPPAWTTSGSRPIRWATSRPPASTAGAGPSTATTSCGGSSATPRSSRTCCGSPARCPRCGRPRCGTCGGRRLDRDRVDRRRGPADRPRPVPHRRREVRRARPPLRRDDAAEAARHGDARRRRVRLHRQGGQAPGDHRHRRGGPVRRARAGPAATTRLDSLFCFQDGGAWRPLRSHDVSSYIATRAGGHFTAKEFRTWNATVLMALLLANAEPAPTARSRKSAITAGVRGWRTGSETPRPWRALPTSTRG